jgi:hypothetical protein
MEFRTIDGMSLNFSALGRMIKIANDAAAAMDTRPKLNSCVSKDNSSDALET